MNKESLLCGEGFCYILTNGTVHYIIISVKRFRDMTSELFEEVIMKLCRRIMVLFMCAAVLCGVSLSTSKAVSDDEYSYLYGDDERFIYKSSGCYGTEKYPLEYPVTRRFAEYKGYKSYVDWYESKYLCALDESRLQDYMALLWYDYSVIRNEEVISYCNDTCIGAYLETFDRLIADAKTVYTAPGDNTLAYKVESVTAKDNLLIIDVSVNIYMEYDYHERSDGEGYCVTIDSKNAYMGFGIRNRNGELVFCSRLLGGDIVPVYRYGYFGRENNAVYDKDYYAPYISSYHKTIKVTMPEMFDPEFYTVDLFFTPSPLLADLESPEFFNVYNGTELAPQPVRGDASGDGELNLDDVSLTMKFIAEWDGITVDETAADVNLNGRIGLTDVCLMLKLIAGWDIGTSFK